MQDYLCIFILFALMLCGTFNPADPRARASALDPGRRGPAPACVSSQSSADAAHKVSKAASRAGALHDSPRFSPMLVMVT